LSILQHNVQVILSLAFLTSFGVIVRGVLRLGFWLLLHFTLNDVQGDRVHALDARTNFEVVHR
jgi:hypothetical protein